MSQRPETPRTTPKTTRFPFGFLAGVVGALAALGFCIRGAIVAWRSADEANPAIHMTVHGWAALVIAFVMVGVLGAGFMGLAFHSSKKGYDERAAGREE